MSKTQLRILISGGREFKDEDYVHETLDGYLHLNSEGNLLLAHGAADGVDTFSDNWAIKRGVLVKRYPVEKSEIDILGRNAPRRRNQRMLDDFKPHIAIIFPGSNGTRDMRSRLIASSVHIIDFTREYLSKQ